VFTGTVNLHQRARNGRDEKAAKVVRVAISVQRNLHAAWHVPSKVVASEYDKGRKLGNAKESETPGGQEQNNLQAVDRLLYGTRFLSSNEER